MNSKDNFATGKPPAIVPSTLSTLPPLRLAFRYHPLSRLLFSTLDCPLQPRCRWKFHSKWTPLCKYARESLLMLSWGGQRPALFRRDGQGDGAWLVAPASVTKPKECVSRIYINPHGQHRFSIITDLFTDGCENKKCEFYGECESDNGGEAKCVCPSKCEILVSLWKATLLL